MEALIHGVGRRAYKAKTTVQEAEFFLRAYFLSCLIVITAISIYDAYLVVLYKSLIKDFERNPVCMALIELDPGGLSYFLCGKALGTICVVTALSVLYQNRRKHWFVVSTSVATFQICLLAFLTFGTTSF